MKTIAWLSFILLLSLPTILKAQPIVNLGVDTTVCGDSLLLDAQNPSATSWTWSTGETTQLISADSSGLYWVEVIDGSGTTRDSIVVTINPQPTIIQRATDTSYCQGIINITAQASPGSILWKDSSNTLIGSGDTLLYNLQNTSKIWYEAARFFEEPTVVGMPNFTGGAFYGASGRGITFNVSELLRIDTVSININNGVSGDVVLRDNLGAIIASKAFSLATAGVYALDLGFIVPVGFGYNLYLENLTGAGQVYSSITFPSWTTNFNYSFMDLTGSATGSAAYQYFYRWRVSRVDASCSSGLDSVLITALPTPVVDLGNDTSICGSSFVLDATNVGAGYAYIWAPLGETTATINVLNTDYYYVSITSGGQCLVSDSIYVELRTQPTITLRAIDSAYCQGPITVVAQSSAGDILWRDSANNIISVGDTLNYNLQDSSKIWYDAAYFLEETTVVGMPNFTGGAFYGASGRGITFSVSELLRIDSVSININNDISGEVVLRDDLGAVVASKFINLTGAAIHTLDLGFVVPVGTGYNLHLENLTGAGQVYSSIVFPPWATNFNYSFMDLTGSSTGSAAYQYFYRWRVSILDASCNSDLDSVLVNALETPVVNLGQDTSVCGNSLVLDATNVGAGYAYNWTPGNLSTAMITALNDGAYYVTVTSGGQCPVVDSINIQIRTKPVILQRAVDSAFCRGPVLVTAQTSHGDIIWKDSSGTIVEVGDTFRFDLQDTTKVWYDAAYWETLSTLVGMPNFTGGAFYGASGRGITFKTHQILRIDSVTININDDINGDVVLRDSSGAAIAQTTINLSGAGLHTLDLGFVVPIGVDFNLYIENLTGPGQIYSSISFPAWATNFNYPFMDLTGSSTGSAAYQYFYRWKISTLDVSCTSDLDSVLVSALPTPNINLGLDTSVCGNNLTLDATNTGSGFAYQWLPGGQGTPTITVSSTGIYSVIVTSGGQCPVGDSIDVEIRPRPIITQTAVDASFCEGLIATNALASAGFIIWKDSFNNTIGIGDTLLYDLSDTIQLWYEAAYLNEESTVVGMTSFIGGAYYGASDRGISFTTHQPVRIDSVSININGPIDGVVVLRDNLGTAIASKAINFASAGIYVLDLNFIVPTNTGYNLYIENLTGTGEVYSSTSFPAWATNFNYPFMDLIGSSTGSAAYQYFYNWRVSTVDAVCVSDMDSVVIGSLPTPKTDLGPDTVVCNNTYLLDASFPNATYIWSNSDMTPTLTVTSENTYSVTVSVNTCVAEDSIEIFLNSSPSIAILSADTTTCKGIIDRITTGADVYKWYDDSIGGNYLGTGTTFLYNAQDSGTIWVEGQNFSNKVYSYGLDSGVLSSGGFFFPTETRGLVFDVDDDIFLESVSIYVRVGNDPFTGTVELWDENNVVVYSTAIPAVFTPGEQEIVINLNYQISPGQNYKLMLPNYSAATILWEFPAAYPIVENNLSIVSGTPGLDRYYYFYNWKVREVSCPSSRLPSVVNVLETPDLDFPKDSIVCGDSLILDLSASNIQTFAWNTGATSSIVTIDSNMVVSLTATVGSCSITDSLNVFIVEPPDLIIPPADTTVCEGNLTLYASGNAAFYAWYDSSSSVQPFSIGDSIIVNMEDSTTLWVEGIGFIPKSKPIGEVYSSTSNLNVWVDPGDGIFQERGLYFDVNEPIIFNSLKMYVDTATTGILTIYKSGFPYYVQSLNLTNVGENLVQIDTLLEPGNYFIELRNKSKGKILILSPYTNFNLISTPEITFLGSTPLANRYNYFLEWQISTPSCATVRLPVKINVPPSPNITMVADTATCTESSLVIDPVANNNPNYTYLWNTTSQNDTLVVSSSGYYSVTVTNDGICSLAQDIFVQFLDTPNDPAINDTSICSSGTIDLGYKPSDGIMVWYDDAALGQVTHLTAPYTTYVSGATDFWVNAAPRATTRIGIQSYPDPTEQSSYLNFIIASTFDVHEHAVLDSVAVYVDAAPTTIGVVLRDSSGNMIHSSTHTVTQAYEKVFLPLNYLLPPGEKYQLSFSSINTSFLVDRAVVSTPSSSAEIASLTGTIFTGVNYTSFFDWHFSYAYPDCHAVADTFTVSVNIPVDLPDSIYTCDTAFIDITDPNVASYYWSIGQTTGAVALSDPGMYYVTMSDGGVCTVIDSIEVIQPKPVGLPTGNAACDYILSTNYSMSEATFNWSTNDTTNEITIAGAGIYYVTVTTNEGCVLYDTAAITQIVPPPTPNLGTVIDACFADTLDAGFGGQAMTYVWNTGESSQTIIVNTSGFYTVTVTHPLGCSGSDYVQVNIDQAPVASFLTFESGLSVGVTNTSSSGGQGTTYEWNFGDSIGYYSIPNPAHTYPDSNCYTIQLIVTDACGADTAISILAIGLPDSLCDTINSIVLIEPKMLDIGFDIIPNPNTGNFQIRLAAVLREESQLMLYDINGRVVYEQKISDLGQKQWDVRTNNLTDGVYFVRLVNSKQSRTDRVVILRE